MSFPARADVFPDLFTQRLAGGPLSTEMVAGRVHGGYRGAGAVVEYRSKFRIHKAYFHRLGYYQRPHTLGRADQKHLPAGTPRPAGAIFRHAGEWSRARGSPVGHHRAGGLCLLPRITGLGHRYRPDRRGPLLWHCGPGPGAVGDLGSAQSGGAVPQGHRQPRAGVDIGGLRDDHGQPSHLVGGTDHSHRLPNVLGQLFPGWIAGVRV